MRRHGDSWSASPAYATRLPLLRLFGAQFVGWLGDHHWLDLARSANNTAEQLSAGLARLPGVRIVWPTEANEVFAVLPRTLDARLRAVGAVYYEWNPNSLPHGESLGENEVLARFVTSFVTSSQDVSDFLELARVTRSTKSA